MYTNLEEYLAVKQILEEYLVETWNSVQKSFTYIEPFNYNDLSSKSVKDNSIMICHLHTHEYALERHLRVFTVVRALKETLDKVYGHTEVIENGQLTIVYDLIGPRKTKKEANYLGYAGILAFKEFSNASNYYDIIGEIAINKFVNHQIPFTVDKENLDEKKATEEVFMLDNLTKKQKVYYDVLIRHLIRYFRINNQAQARQHIIERGKHV